MMRSFLSHTMRLTAIACLPAGLLTLAIPIPPAVAGNQFDACVTQITSSGVPGDQAGTACAGALIPKELSSCVLTIKQKTAVPGEDALKACFRVRRPVDLASCVVEINNQTLATTAAVTETSASDGSKPILMALDSCRRSLLPLRYSECVTALSRDIQNLSPQDAMNTCLNAEDFPRDLFPAYTNQ